MKKKILTKVELELMNILWSLSEASVHEIRKHLPKERPLAYNSVSTMVRILQKKGVVDVRKEGRTHYYFPIITKQTYSIANTQSLLTDLFGGDALKMVSTLIDQNPLSNEELQRIRKMIEEKEDE